MKFGIFTLIFLIQLLLLHVAKTALSINCSLLSFIFSLIGASGWISNVGWAMMLVCPLLMATKVPNRLKWAALIGQYTIFIYNIFLSVLVYHRGDVSVLGKSFYMLHTYAILCIEIIYLFMLVIVFDFIRRYATAILYLVILTLMLFSMIAFL
jgi:hypothetical protein